MGKLPEEHKMANFGRTGGAKADYSASTRALSVDCNKTLLPETTNR